MPRNVGKLRVGITLTDLDGGLLWRCVDPRSEIVVVDQLKKLPTKITAKIWRHGKSG